MKIKKWKTLDKETKKFFLETKSIKCPAFPGEKVVFTSKGRNHLFYKGARSERTLKEINVRVLLLPNATILLRKMSIPQEEDKTTSKDGKVIRYWAFEGVVRDRITKVIVRQVGKGNKHFWSVAPAWRKSRFGRRNIRSGRLKNV